MITTNPTIDLTDRNPVVVYLDDGVAIAACLGSPEGLIYAAIGCQLVDVTTGESYRKTTAQTLNTGWVISNAPASGSPIGKANSQFTPVQNSGSAETALQSYSYPASSFKANGDFSQVVMFGRTAANANAKELRVYFGGVLFFTTGGVNWNNLAFRVDMWIMRTGASAQQIICTVKVEGNSFDNTVQVSLALPWSSAQSIALTGQGTATGDITQNCTIVTRG